MKKTTRILSVIFAIVLVIGTVSVGLSAYAATGDALGNYDFTIQNVYKDINWSNVKKYKAATHVHTVRSDADIEIDDMVWEYYDLGFDALALTDHGTVNYGWTEDQDRLTIFEYQYFVHGPTDEISTSDYKKIIAGTRSSSSRPSGMGGMMEIPLGIELNGASTSKCHINSYYADAGHGDLEMGTSWPRTAVQKSYNAGGFTHINHVGEWTDGKDTPATYNNDWLTRFTSIYEDYCPNRGGRNSAAQTTWMSSHNGEFAGCIGMELVNTSDNRTKNDRRYVYDEILKRLAPQGINVFGFCEDDSHEYSDCDRNAQFFLINGNKSVAVSEANASPGSSQITAAQQLYKEAMFYGEFLTSSKSSKNAYELGEGFSAQGVYPSVTNISVDNSKDQISISCVDATKVRLVADGMIISTVKTSASGQTVVFDLNQFEDKINSYVRIYMTGDGGITYLQPFLVSKTASSQATVQFILPTIDTTVLVYDSNNSLINDSRKYENNYYVLDAGTYTYTASRKGYKTTNSSFVVTAADIASNNQKKIQVELEEDSDVTPTYFYVPETIYVSPDDGRTFTCYIDRANTTVGALNKNASTSGNIFFSREDSTNISLTWDLYDGVDISSISFRNNTTTSSSTSLSTGVTAGMTARVMTDGEYSLIKWTATYNYKGATCHAYAYSYVYKTPSSNTTALVGAGSYGSARKNAAEWPHSSMWTSMSVFVTGVHRIESSSGIGYKFAPYYGETIYDIGKPYEHSPTVSGNGYSWDGDNSQGGSGSGSITGGVGHYYADKSRVDNINQFPYFTIGVDFNAADECVTYDENVQAYAQFDGRDLVRITFNNSNGTYTKVSDYRSASNNQLTTETGASGGEFFNNFSGTRIYYSDTSTSQKFSFAIPDESENYTINFFARGKKTGSGTLGMGTATRTAICIGSITLALDIVDKATLRTSLATAIRRSLQEEWFTSSLEWETYLNAIVEASRVLGDPTADEDMINTAYNNLERADDNLQLKTGAATVKHYWSYDGNSDLIYSEDSYSYYYGSGLVANSVEMAGYTYSRYECYADGSLLHQGSSDVDTVVADKGSYEWRFFYNPAPYNVTYKANSGSVYTPDSGTIAYYDQNYTIANNFPSREGYIFDGWYLDLSSNTYSSGESIKWVYTDNGELSANWTPIKYSVSYNTNGGAFAAGFTIPNEAKKAEYDATYSIIPEIPTKTGYTFNGWQLSGGNVYTGGGQFIWNIASDGEFVAQWGTTPYVVSFDPVLSGVTVSPTSKTVYFGYPYGDLPASERTGYSVSWYSNPSYTTASLVTKSTNVSIASDHTLYAKWSPIVYSIRYSLDGGTLNGTNPTSYTIESSAMTLLNPTKTGYIFSGWSGTGISDPDISTSVTIPAGQTGDRNYTAHWSLSGYTITYNGLDGASNDSRNPASYAYNTSTFTIYPATKKGYTFTGWTGTGLSGLTTTFSIPSGSTGNKIFTANWQKDNYTITYDLNGGTATGNNPTSYNIDTPTFRLSNPTKEGFRFTGWQETLQNSGLDGQQVDVATGTTGNLNFVAGWTAITNFVVTYDLAGGTIIGSNPTAYNTGDYYRIINPTKAGYDFTGWIKSYGTITQPAAMVAEIGGNEGADISFTATWSSAINYTISYNLDGGEIKVGTNPTSYNITSSEINLINPTKIGYNFLGWEGTGLIGAENTSVTIPSGSTGNRSYTARWRLKTFTITYDYHGGADSGLPKQYNYNSNLTVGEPVRTGYTFTGWSVKYNDFDWSLGNITVAGRFQTGTNYISEPIVLRNGKTYSFSSAGAISNLSLRIFKTDGSFLATYSYSLSKPSYTATQDCVAYIVAQASGYGTEELRNSVRLNVSGTHMSYSIPSGSTGSMTFVADWNVIEYDINYFLNSGALADGDSNPSKYTVESETFTLNNPLKTGYSFVGWRDDNDAVSNSVTIAKGSVGHRNYTAVWSETVYNITYNLNGGSASNVSTYTYTQQVRLNEPTKTGYNFEGWIGTELTSATKTVQFKYKTGDRSYTATWTPITYSINYTLNGGTNSSANPRSYTVESPAITLYAPEQTGAVFLGWSGTDITGVSRNVVINAGSTGARSYEANWDLNIYHITYDLEGGTLTGSNPTEYNVNTPDFTLINPTRAGYTFGGWTGTNLSYMTEFVTVNQGSTGDRSYIACWIPRTYTITYDLAGGQVAEYANPTDYTTDTPTFTLENPVRTGFIFMGWTGTGLSEPTQTVTINMGSTGNRSYKATWNEDGYSITYILNGGRAENPSRYTVLTASFTLNNPVRDGYRFLGWSGTGISGSGISTSVEIPQGSTGDRTYEANWEIQVYNLSYNLDGGSEVLTNPRTYTYTSSPITLFTPVKTGYIFTGWESDYYDGIRQSVTINTGSTGDKGFIAIWESGVYSLTYELNGGSLSSGNPSSYTYNSATFTLNNPTRSGYTFAGWSGTNIDGNERTVTIYNHSTGDRHYVANWSESNNIITYTLNGGTVANGTNPTSYITNSGNLSIIDPTRKGYSFRGWSVTTGSSIVTGDAVSGTSYIKNAVVNTTNGGNVDFVAIWSAPINYTITYVLNSGTVSPANPSSYTVESNITLNNPTRAGFRFVGWSGTGLGTNKYETVNIASGSTGNRKYTANWEVAPYSITYDYAGGYVDNANPTNYSVLSSSITLNNPVKPGYKFTGWTGSNGDRPQLSVVIPAGSSGNKSYTANYDIVTYKISYLGTTGATFSATPTEYTVNTSTFTLNRPSKAGYTFLGWTGTDVLNKTLDVTVEQGSFGNRTYIANWSLIDYSISYNLNGGEEVAANPTKYNAESADIKLTNPTRTGYAFTGWSEGSSSSTSLNVVIPTGSTGNKVYTAHWSSEVYTITYNGWLGEVSNPTSYNTAQTITLTNPVRAGYNFLGWVGTDLSSVTRNVEIPAGSSGNRVYSTVWKIAEYSITVSLNGGTSTNIPQSYTINSDTITLPTPKRSGYDFVGWSGTGISGTSKNVTIPSGSTGDRVFEAVWNRRGENTHRIYYYGYMDEPLKLQQVDGKYVNYYDYVNGSAIDPVTPPTVLGYKFNGWDVDLSLDYYKNYTEDLDVHAVYVKDTKLYYVIIDGVQKTAAQYDTITLDAASTKNGADFKYWIDPDTNEIVSYYRNYTFNVYEHDGASTDTFRLQSVYSTADSHKAATRVTRIENYNSYYDWFSVYVERSVRTDYTLIQHGIIFTTSQSLGTSESNFVIGKPGVYNPIAYNSSNAKNGVWTISIRNPRQYNSAIYIRSYVKVVDDSGNLKIEYSKIKTYSNTEDTTA